MLLQRRMQPQMGRAATVSVREDPWRKPKRSGEEGSLADALFSLHSQQEGLNIEIAPQPPTTLPAASSSASRQAERVPSSTAPVAPASPTPSLRSKLQPVSLLRTPNALACHQSARLLLRRARKGSKAKNGASLKGQTSLQSFFAKRRAAVLPLRCLLQV